MLEHHPAAITMELDQEEEEDVKPPPTLIVELQPQEALEQRDQEHMVHVMERSPSTSLSSVDIRMLSPSPIPRRDEFFRLDSGERFRSACGVYGPQMLQMLKEEHHIILENQRKIGLYIQEKRDGLKRRQELEEELLRAKIKVEKLKAIRLRRDLPEFNSLWIFSSSVAQNQGYFAIPFDLETVVYHVNLDGSKPSLELNACMVSILCFMQICKNKKQKNPPNIISHWSFSFSDLKLNQIWASLKRFLWNIVHITVRKSK